MALAVAGVEVLACVVGLGRTKNPWVTVAWGSHREAEWPNPALLRGANLRREDVKRGARNLSVSRVGGGNPGLHPS